MAHRSWRQMAAPRIAAILHETTDEAERAAAAPNLFSELEGGA